MFISLLLGKIILRIDCCSKNNILFNHLDRLDFDEIAFDGVYLDDVSIEKMF